VRHDEGLHHIYIRDVFSELAIVAMYEYSDSIQVRWVWLSFPVTIVRLLLVFSAYMVVYWVYRDQPIASSEAVDEPVFDISYS
jgi:hypothetical protein